MYYTCTCIYVYTLLPFVSMDRTHSNDSHQIQKEGVYHQHSKIQCLPEKVIYIVYETSTGVQYMSIKCHHTVTVIILVLLSV